MTGQGLYSYNLRSGISSDYIVNLSSLCGSEIDVPYIYIYWGGGGEHVGCLGVFLALCQV